MNEVYIWVVIILTLLVIGLLSAWLHIIKKLNYMTRHADHQESRAIRLYERWEQSSFKVIRRDKLLAEIAALITEAKEDE